MTAVIAGQSVTLLSQWFDFEGGSLTDLDGTPTIAVTNIGTGTTALSATSSGVTHPATGSYGYTWTPSASLAAGSYLATWAGLKNGSPVTATETVTVTAPATTEAANTSPAGVWYCTREDVARALDVAETARSWRQIDRACEAAARAIEGRMHRKFYPVDATRTFSWPNAQYARPWRLWLNENELISVSALTAAGETISAADYFLEPASSGPPYNRVEIDLSSSAAFGGGDTHQRSISITGTFGYSAGTTPAGALAEALDASETAVDITDESLIGVGDILIVDSERMIVTGKSMLDTGQNLGGNLTAQNSAVTVAVTTGSSYSVGEVILIDAERMLVVDIAGNNLIVKRAWDGSVLAAHTAGADIYAPRTLTVTRGALGTTAAAHSSGAAATRHVVPGLIRDLAVALALSQLLQEGAGYARVAGAGENAREVSGRGLRALWDDAYAAYGRKARIRGV